MWELDNSQKIMHGYNLLKIIHFSYCIILIVSAYYEYMVNTLNNIRRFFKQLLGFLPETLPQGATAFDNFVTDVIETWDMPTPLRSDIEYVIAMNIVGQNSDRRSKMYFVRLIRAAAAKQIAHANMQRIYNEKKAEQAAQSQPAEVTAPQAVTNGPQQ